MEYITLNNIKNTDIKGLMICNLPPISKPLKRTTIEEIEGKDGDEIIELGYSAYDKELTIGLTYNYDIDEIISYFNSEGIVTFSNEPNKYYKYKIIEQIDFEKLLRFKTAKVKLHVQPFKHSTEERIKTYGITIEKEISIINSGNIVSKPRITFTGTGISNISLNGLQVLVLTLGSTTDSITIDFEKLEAYDPSRLRNRDVDGDYDKFNLNIGKNTISFTGTLTKIEIENYSRWI